MTLLLRLGLAILFASLGNFVASSSIPPNAPVEVPVWTGLAATIIFGIIGFLLIDILSFLAKAGIIKLAQELGRYIPTPKPSNPLRIRLPKRVEATNQVILDTSAIVDGRIFEIVKTGFLTGQLLIPSQVLGELQHLADSKDELKRLRGRTALDNLQKLKKEKHLLVKILNSFPKGKEVDDQLIELAKKIKGKIATCDYNLGKVAKLKNIQILNVNELAQAVRMPVLPGEALEIDLVDFGKTKNQGVGYLSDGTMIVVEDGGKSIGKTVQIKVHRSLQTAAGRMVFAKLA